MNTSLLRLALLCVAGTTACAESQPAKGAESAHSDSSGTSAPDFTARDLSGKTFRLSDHLGKKVILLDFWSTYCEPCKAEFPHLNELYETHKAKGLIVVGVSMDGPETMADVPAFAQRYGLKFPIVFDEDSRVASLFNPKKSAPLAVIIGKDGRIAAIRDGYNPGDEKFLTEDVEKALGPM